MDGWILLRRLVLLEHLAMLINANSAILHPLKQASHLDPPANGQAVVYLTGLLEVFISEPLILATVSDNSVRYQAI